MTKSSKKPKFYLLLIKKDGKELFSIEIKNKELVFHGDINYAMEARKGPNGYYPLFEVNHSTEKGGKK